jgi:hypothetical protein
MLKTTGAVILVIGMAAGVALVTSPFGLLQGASASPAAGLLFPAGFAAGSILLALGGPSVGGLWRLYAALLLLLTIGAAAGLGLAVVGMAEPVGHTLSLWYVLLLAGSAGTACALGPARLPATETARS